MGFGVRCPASLGALKSSARRAFLENGSCYSGGVWACSYNSWQKRSSKFRGVHVARGVYVKKLENVIPFSRGQSEIKSAGESVDIVLGQFSISVTVQATENLIGRNAIARDSVCEATDKLLRLARQSPILNASTGVPVEGVNRRWTPGPNAREVHGSAKLIAVNVVA